MQNILPPPALQGDERAQLTQLYRYLFRLSEQLNVGLSALEGGPATVMRAQNGSGGALSPEGTDSEQFWTEADAQYRSLKSLIIKTANTVRAEMDQIVTNLGSEYVAQSEWGAYKESVHTEIIQTAKSTIESYQYKEGVENLPDLIAMFDSYRIETSGSIMRGIIGYDDEGYPIIGIAIGQDLAYKEVVIGGEVYKQFDDNQYLATYTAKKMSFWLNGVEVAYLSGNELVVTRIIVSDSIQLGDWKIEVNKEDGMTIQKRIGDALDLSGNNTITITADKINAIAQDIDLSANTSIRLTADQVNAVADQINLKGNASVTLIAGQEAQNRLNGLQIGGRNLLLKSATKYIVKYSGSTLAFEDDVTVAEWGATNAIRCTGTGGTSRIFGTFGGLSVPVKSVNGQAYTYSIYLRNDGASRIRITNNNLGGSEYVEVGESRRVVMHGTGNGTYNIGMLLYTETAGDAIDVTYWHPKIEMGNVATDWSPAPEDSAEIFTGDNPPALPLSTGALWIDTGVTPTVIRRWKGTGTSTDRDEDGWDVVSDLEEINEISNKLRAQQAEAQRAIDELATAITIDTGGAHFYKPGYRDRSEVRIDQDSVDILVNGSVNSSFIAGGLILGNYMLWHPAAAGGLAFNLYTEE